MGDIDRHKGRSPSPRSRRSPSPRRRDRSPRGRHRSFGSDRDKKDSTTLFIGNLPYHFKEQDIYNYFEKYGRIKHVTVGINKRTKQSKGYSFVEFAERRDAEQAFERLDGYTLEGRQLRLDWDIGLGKKQQMFGYGSSSRGRYGYPGGYSSHRHRRRSPSPRGRRSPSPRGRRSPSPRGRRSPSPRGRRGSPSPRGRRSPSPRRRDRSPDRSSPRRSPVRHEEAMEHRMERKRPRSPSPVSSSTSMGEKRQRVAD